MLHDKITTASILSKQLKSGKNLIQVETVSILIQMKTTTK